MPDEISRRSGSPLLPAAVRNNPLFAMSLGLCPALAVTYRVDNAIAMGATVFVVLLLTVVVMSLVGARLPQRFRLAAVLFVASCFTTIASLLLGAADPALTARLGIYLPLVAVNCLVLGRAERFFAGGRLTAALRDGLSGGFAFFVSLLLISLIREIIGSGRITLFAVGSFDGVIRLGGVGGHPVLLVGYSAGALLVFGYLQALSVSLSGKRKEKRR